MLFCLKIADFEYQQNKYFVGPEMNQEEFKSLCDSFLSIAAIRCLDNIKDYSIQWTDLIEEVAVLLCENGFETVNVNEVEYFEGLIGKSASNLIGEENTKKIQLFNQNLKNQLHSEIRCFTS